MEVVRALSWIRDSQEHVNSCADELDDAEALAVALELQQAIDSEWDRLGDLVEGRNRPFSILRDRDRARGSRDLRQPIARVAACP